MARPRLLWLTFFGAGFAGLALQIVWVRVFSLIFGASNYAVSTVLAAYMAGLALGGVMFGRLTHGRDVVSLVRIYSRLLAGVGISGFLVTILAPHVGVLLAPLLGAVGWNSGWSIALRGLFSFLLLLVPATMLGGLFPVVSHLAVEDLRLTGARLAGLYFTNTAGSVLGALVAGFVLLERLGVVGTTGLACLLALALCGIGYRPAPGQRQDAQQDARKTDSTRAAPKPYGRRAQIALLAAYGISGFAGLGYEVVWARALTTVVGHPLYSVTIVTATFLFGLALGSLVFGRLSDRWRDPSLGLGIIETSIAGTALLTLVLAASLNFSVLDWIAAHLGGGWVGTMLGLAGSSFLVMLAPTLLMGATFPVVGKALVTERNEAGRMVGWLYAVNSAGALLGSLVAGFALVPSIGATKTNVVLAGASLTAAAIAVLSSHLRTRHKGIVLATSGGVCLAIVLLTGARQLQFLPPSVTSSRSAWQVLYYRESSEGVVTTTESRSGERQTWVNSSAVCSNALPALKTVRIMGVVPFCVHENPQDVLVIGYGLGVTTSVMVSLSPKIVDCVEISPRVVEASRAFARWNESVFASPRLNIMPGDGRNYLLCTNKQYDIISCDPTHPSDGSGALYTREFYQLVKKRLRPGGVFTLYMPFHQLREQDFRRLINTFRSEFPQSALWLGIAHGVLVGRKDKRLALDYQRVQAVFRAMPLWTRVEFAEVFLDDAAKLCATMVLDSAGMARVGDAAGLATDGLPAFEYAGAREGVVSNWAANAELVWRVFTESGRLLIAGAGADSSRIANAANATAARFAAAIAAERRDRDGHTAWLRRALEFDPSDREAAHFLFMSLPRKQD